MELYTTKPVAEISKIEFKEILKENIEISFHALDHLSKGQRKIFKEDELVNIIKKENARKIYLQENKRYALYYRKSEGYIKIILEIENNKTIVVSFMNVIEMPKIRLK